MSGVKTDTFAKNKKSFREDENSLSKVLLSIDLAINFTINRLVYIVLKNKHNFPEPKVPFLNFFKQYFITGGSKETDVHTSLATVQAIGR